MAGTVRQFDNAVMPYGAAMFAGQRFYAQTSDAYNPVAIGTQAVALPSIVPSVATTSVYAKNQINAQNANNSPFDFFQSPVIIAILFLLVSILGLRFIHFRES